MRIPSVGSAGLSGAQIDDAVAIPDIVALVTCAFAAVVVLAMISKSRLKIEQRLQLLESSHSHP